MIDSRVWITGAGVCTPLGNSSDELAEALLSGRSGVTPVRRFDVSQHPSQIAAQVGWVPTPPEWDAAEFARRDNIEQLVGLCCVDALRSAGLWNDRAQRRIGVVMGIGSEWLIAWEADGPGHLRTQMQSSLESVTKYLGLTGPAMTLGAACASANYAFSVARSWLRSGIVDACIAGGCDRCVTPMVLASFGNLRALSRRNDDPVAASRPFDRGRDGFVLGEGGAACVLERAEDVMRRGARGRAEIAGFGATSDAHHMVIPSPDSSGATEAIRRALTDAKVNPDEVDYINAHGTGTPIGDVCEAQALRRAFGAAAERVPVSSTKSMTGHLLTAAAAIEALAGVAAIEHNAIPPTINLDDPDPECPLNHVANRAREQKVNVVVSNSFGFGGSNTTLVLKSVA